MQDRVCCSLQTEIRGVLEAFHDSERSHQPDLLSKAAGHRNSASVIFASHCLPSTLTVHSAMGSQRDRIAKQFTA